MIRKFILPLLFATAFTCAAPAVAAISPMQYVQTTIDGILAALRDKNLDRDSRREKILDYINDSFDFRSMSQRTLATNWRKASDAEQDAFVDRFAKLIQSTYMGRLEAYTDEKIKYTKERIKGDKAIINTHIVTSSVEIPINYKMKQDGDRWRVYDVIIEEVSLISSYRSSYQSLIDKEGFKGLLAAMDDKINELNSAAEQTAEAAAQP